MLPGGQHGASLAGWGWAEGPGECGGAVGGDRLFGADGHRWSVGAVAGGSQRVVLALVDTVSGLIHPPVVVEEEESASAKAAQGLAEGLAQQARQQVRQELTALLHAIIDAPSYEQAEQALARLMAHAFGAGLGKKLNEQLDRLFMHQLQPELRSGTIGGSCGSAPSGFGATSDYA